VRGRRRVPKPVMRYASLVSSYAPVQHVPTASALPFVLHQSVLGSALHPNMIFYHHSAPVPRQARCRCLPLVLNHCLTVTRRSKTGVLGFCRGSERMGRKRDAPPTRMRALSCPDMLVKRGREL
jgi:hypothetical protein